MALEHITVLDLTHMLSGPYGTMLLADLGARTIKVEPPVAGEGTRRLLEHDPDYSIDGMGAYYLTLNRNKESVCVDLKTDAGKAVFFDLVRKADVVYDNFSVGVTERLGIDHATLIAINPRIITCSVTGFGQTGPEINRPAFDQVVQAMGGGMSITGAAGGEPTRSGIPIGDLCGGIFGSMGVLAAIAQREQSGCGQHVDVSMLDSQISMLNYMATMHLMSGILPGAIGNGHFVHVPYNSFTTSDGHVIVACIGDAFFLRFVETMNLPSLQKPEYAQQPVRYAARAEIEAIVNEEMKGQTSAYWLEKLRAARIPCGPVNNFAQALGDTQVNARNMVVDVELASGKTVRMPGNPMKLSASAAQQYSRPPALGEHTGDVLEALLGYSGDTVAQLRRDGAIG
ncbi:MAG: crotonobetainyl-CoA:carnitine CoA-transferase CaiB-like acyl-CoA transferase [Burkholderiaceae bacterium]|jgi:crotonobetainyl-CoA:carnitine CoA-transferase CaiB-like acyl-CoA transferase